MPNYIIQYKKPTGQTGTYDIYAESPEDARRLVVARGLPERNSWSSFEVLTQPAEQAPISEPAPTVAPSIAPAAQPGGDWYGFARDSRSNNNYQIGPFGIQQEAITALNQFMATKPGAVWDNTGSGPGARGGKTTISPADIASQPAADSTGDVNLNALLAQFPALLQLFLSMGMKVNPNITIGLEHIAEFTKIAESEINPFYANQLKIAREELAKSQGYSQEDYQLLEEQLAQKYPQQIRQLGEAAAEKGLALSGQRVLEEGQLAEDIGQQLATARRGLQRQATTQASQFAQQFGARQLPISPTLGQYRAIPGQPTIEKTRDLPLYQLSEDVYRGLTGEQEFGQRAALRERKAGLAGLTRTLGSIEATRQLL